MTIRRSQQDEERLLQRILRRRRVGGDGERHGEEFGGGQVEQFPERVGLAAASAGASGRDLRDVCEAAERRWAARRVRNEASARGRTLPPAAEYDAALSERISHMNHARDV